MFTTDPPRALGVLIKRKTKMLDVLQQGEEQRSGAATLPSNRRVYLSTSQESQRLQNGVNSDVVHRRFMRPTRRFAH
jgi:hypothetical protein